MTARTVDTDLVTRICRDATATAAAAAAGTGTGTVVDVAHDPLDGTIWVRMSSWPCAREAMKVLNAHGISAHDLEDCRLHVTGWDARLLHWRLGALLAGVDDLRTEWDATVELVRYHYDRRVEAGVEPEQWAILSDVETAMRSCVPIPHRAPRVNDIETLLELVTAAEDAYQQLIAEHVEHAERILNDHIAGLRQDGAA